MSRKPSSKDLKDPYSLIRQFDENISEIIAHLDDQFSHISQAEKANIKETLGKRMLSILESTKVDSDIERYIEDVKEPLYETNKKENDVFRTFVRGVYVSPLEPFGRDVNEDNDEYEDAKQREIEQVNVFRKSFMQGMSNKANLQALIDSSPTRIRSCVLTTFQMYSQNMDQIISYMRDDAIDSRLQQERTGGVKSYTYFATADLNTVIYSLWYFVFILFQNITKYNSFVLDIKKNVFLMISPKIPISISEDRGIPYYYFYNTTLLEHLNEYGKSPERKIESLSMNNSVIVRSYQFVHWYSINNGVNLTSNTLQNIYFSALSLNPTIILENIAKLQVYHGNSKRDVKEVLIQVNSLYGQIPNHVINLLYLSFFATTLVGQLLKNSIF